MLGVILNVNIFLLAILYVLTSAKHEYYTGWKSYFVKVSTVEQIIDLNALSKKLDLDILSPALVQREGVVLVKPEHQKEFIVNLANLGITFRSHVSDVKSALNMDDVIIDNWRKSSTREDKDLPFNSYQPFHKIDAFMERIADSFPNTTKLVLGGMTSEGRPLKYMQISTTNFEDKRKPVIVIEGGTHAREWIAPPVVTWAIKKLTEDVTEPDLLSEFDWILMPVVNPDGYNFTFTILRMWRKNRSRGQKYDGSLCRGVDLNRNYDIAWNTVGTENHQCSYYFPGTHAFSEVESQVVRNILQKHIPRIIMYLSMHSHGNLILHPWGYNTTNSVHHRALSLVGVVMADAFKELALPGNPHFSVGQSSSLLYNCSGIAMDYAHFIGVPLAFTFALPGLSIGSAGFHLDPQYIEEVCRKTWNSIAVGARRASLFFDVN